MSKVKNYLSLIKFSHTIFAMPFALIGFFLGMRPEVVYGVSQWNLNTTIGTDADRLHDAEVVAIQSRYVFAKVLNITSPAALLIVLLLLVILCMVFARSAAM